MVGRVIVLDDAAVRKALTPAVAIGAVRRALLAHQSGHLIAPARLRANLSDGDLIFTAGRLTGTGYGFRVYDTLETTESDQFTAVFDDRTGRLSGILVGDWLGAARTAAIGAVAVDALADPAAGVLGLIGTGRQAWSQVWAMREVRALREVRVYGRDAERRAGFAERCGRELGVPARAVAGPREAVDGAEIVVLATGSGVPVIEADWVPAGAHVTTLGPKVVGRHECPAELAGRVARLVTDSPAQLDAYPEPFFVTDPEQRGRMRALADELGHGPRQGGSMFCSVGLAGTEVAVAAALLESV
jgi:ornithine cyclodeaminase